MMLIICIIPWHWGQVRGATFLDADGNGIPDVPRRYRGPEGRCFAVPSWNPIDMVGGGNYVTYGVLIIAILILGAIVLLVRAIVKKWIYADNPHDCCRQFAKILKH